MSSYELLDLKPGASLKDVKSAFRKKQFAYHPDRNPSGQPQFIKITSAYETIINNLEDCINPLIPLLILVTHTFRKVYTI